MINFSQKYPQYKWAMKIKEIVKSGEIDVSDDTKFIDAPCGNGIIGGILQKEFPEFKFYLVDNNQNLNNSPYIKAPYFKSVSHQVADIFEYRSNGKNNVWLFINSLYCLPDKEKLLLAQASSYKYIIAVFPDINKPNYKYFRRKNPSFVNPSSMTIVETIDFFSKYNFKVQSKNSITKIAFHRYTELFNKMKLPLYLQNLFLNCLDSLCFFSNGNYELVVFKYGK